MLCKIDQTLCCKANCHLKRITIHAKKDIIVFYWRNKTVKTTELDKLPVTKEKRKISCKPLPSKAMVLYIMHC